MTLTTHNVLGSYSLSLGVTYTNHNVSGTFDTALLTYHNILGSYTVDLGVIYTSHDVLGSYSVQSYTTHSLSGSFTLLPAGFFESITSAISTDPKYVKIQVRKLSDGTSILLEDIKSISLNFKRNSPITWGIVLNNKYGKYSPYAGTYAGWLDPDIYASDGSIDKRITIQVTTGGETWTSPDLVLLSRELRTNAEGYELSLAGIDLSQMLMKNNQVVEGWKSTKTTVYYAQAIVASLLQTAKIPSYTIDFTNYPVYQFEVQGERLLDSIQQILWVPGAEWYIDQNNTFVIRMPQQKPDGPADWTYTDNENIFSLSESTEITDLVNQVTVSKVSANTETVDDLTFTVPIDTTGPTTVSLPRPYSDLALAGTWTYLPTARTQEPQHFLWNWIEYQNKDGETIKGTKTNTWTVGSTFYSEVSFLPKTATTDVQITQVILKNYHDAYALAAYPNPNIFADRAVISFTGVASREATTPDAALIAPSFNVTVKDQTSIDTYGLWELDSTPEVSLVPDAATATLIGQRLINESGRLRTQINISVPLNPYLKIGDTLKIIESANGISSYYYLEDFNHSMSPSTWSTSISVTRFLR